MKTYFQNFRIRWLVAALVLSLGGVTFWVIGQTTPPNIKALSLSSDPLFAATGGDKPAIALALSVEFPTVGAQYVAAPGASTDATYTNTNEYLGYYDAESCYAYNNAPTEAPAAGFTVADYKRFDRIGSAAYRMCTNAFSGNFLNWASNSAFDMLRLALSGGDRYIDTPGLTILQRAVIPNGDPTCMWNSGNFPAKQLQRDGGGNGKYWGAIPTAMVNQAAANDVWIANTLNQMYFGTSRTGGCGNTAAYTLGGAASVQKGPSVFSSAKLPNDAVLLGGDGNSYTFTGTREIWFGATVNGSRYWTVLPASGGIDCYSQGGGGPYGGISDPIGGSAKQCFSRPYSGSWSPTAAGLNSDGFFYSRVQVCNTSGSLLQDNRDYDFCKQYPNGNYKPTGSIQKYSDRLRIAAFGYLMDQSQQNSSSQRFGGVLRAPMKYVGLKTFDETGQDTTPTTGNPRAEWDANTGVFKANPENDTSQTVPISGVINYLNKSGRTGPVAGRYKVYDPVGELYGETLRYLQGLPPTPEAVSNITADMYDGFPVSTAWTDPYGGARTAATDYSCLKANIVVVGDVNTWDSRRLFDRTANISNNLPDVGYWNSVVAAFEGANAVTYTDGQGVARVTSNPNTPNTNAQTGVIGQQGPLVGLSYWAHTQDIRGSNWTNGAGPSLQRRGLRVKSYFFDVNENASSNNSYYRQNQGQFFTAAKYGGFETDSANPNSSPYNTYGNPFRRQNGNNDNNVWQNPASPGDANTYYLQSSARSVLTAFDSIFNRASTASRSIAKGATANKNLTAAGSSIFQGAFDTSDWSGDVIATNINLFSTSTITVDTVPAWSASARLALATPATRNIVIGRTGTTVLPTASDFTWTAIDVGVKDALNRTSPSSITDTLGQDRLNYLRGDQTKEGSLFRPRTKLLGDIVNSGVVYSGTPTTSIIPGTASYTSFFSSNLNRVPAVFAGANDGMLHAFNARTGDELFGYIPSWVSTNLSALTNQNYNGNHQAYVDATPAIAEAQVGNTSSATDWKTVLVSGTGAGGPGVFALDVTNPSSFSASNVMWEFTKADDADLGYVVGQPKILKLRTSAPGATVTTYKWFALVASGVNNYAPYPNAAGSFSTTGNPALFLLALDKPPGMAWTSTGANPNYYKLSVPTNAALAITNATGVINLQATLGVVNEVSQVYFGDLHGKVWRLNFAGYGTNDWNFDKLSYYKTGSSPNVFAYPLYIAKDSAGNTQPISIAPTIVSATPDNGVSTYYVAFGTGKYLESSDRSSTAQNSFYVIYEDGTASATAGGASVPGRGRLQAASVNTTTFTVSTPSFKWGRPTTDGDTTKRSGWYFDYAAVGERSQSSVNVVGDNLNFGTLIPASAGAAGACTSGGTGRAYDLNADAGTGTFRLSTVGLFSETLLFSVESATTYSASTSTGRRIKTSQTYQRDSGQTGSADAGFKQTKVISGRLSWRQINNYQDLKN